MPAPARDPRPIARSGCPDIGPGLPQRAVSGCRRLGREGRPLLQPSVTALCHSLLSQSSLQLGLWMPLDALPASGQALTGEVSTVGERRLRPRECDPGLSGTL